MQLEGNLLITTRTGNAVVAASLFSMNAYGGYGMSTSTFTGIILQRKCALSIVFIELAGCSKGQITT